MILSFKVGISILSLRAHLVQPDFDNDPDASELDYDSEEEEFDDGELEGMDEDEQNELRCIAFFHLPIILIILLPHFYISRFLNALSRGGAPQIEAPSKDAETPNKKLTKAEKKALAKAKDQSATTPAVAAVASTTKTTTTTTTTTVSAAAAGLDAVIGQKRRAPDAAAPTPTKEKEGEKKKDAAATPAAKKAKGQDGKAITPSAAPAKEAKETKAKENVKEKKADVRQFALDSLIL